MKLVLPCNSLKALIPNRILEMFHRKHPSFLSIGNYKSKQSPNNSEINRMRNVVSFELSKEIKKDVFRRAKSVGQRNNCESP